MFTRELKRTKRGGPEDQIQEKIIEALTKAGWFVKATHGNMYQSGFPDLYACHKRYGARWIEVKNPTAYSFTPAQIDNFPMFSAAGVGIWILTSAEEHELKKLFLPPNWYMYLGVMR